MSKTDTEVRCPNCDYKLAEYVSRPWGFTCRRCKMVVASPGDSAAAAQPIPRLSAEAREQIKKVDRLRHRFRRY